MDGPLPSLIDEASYSIEEKDDGLAVHPSRAEPLVLVGDEDAGPCLAALHRFLIWDY
jgi:hypothetical protein